MTLLPGEFHDDIQIQIQHIPLATVLKEHQGQRISLEELSKTLPTGWSVYETMGGRYIFEKEDTEDSSWTHPDPGYPQVLYSDPTSSICNVEFEALSYVWGDQSKTTGIYLQNTVVEVTQNLWLALRRVRCDKPRLIWVDALCIDQENLQERNKQVTIMREIYQMADKVLIWLGEEAENSHLIFKHLNEWKKYCEDYRAGRVESRDPMFNESHLNPPQYQGRTRTAFHRLCKRPWFFRSWVIQEVSLAKNAIMMCGSDTETFKLLSRPSSFNSTYHPLEPIDGPSHYHNLSQIGSSSSLQ